MKKEKDESRAEIQVAKMPRAQMKKKLETVPVGAKFWTVPWMMEVTSDGSCYLLSHAPVCRKEKHESAELFVEKLDHGVRCELHGDYKFSFGSLCKDRDYYPVLSLDIVSLKGEESWSKN
jgi:hypothetical protein